MTGFGRGEYCDEGRRMSVEIKTVNHRYCDVNIRMPRKLLFLENNVRNKIKKSLSRGKIDVFIGYEDQSEDSDSITYNADLLKQYLKHFGNISHDFDLDNDIRLSHIIRLPEVFQLKEKDNNENLLWQALNDALEVALEKVVESRSLEGEQLKIDIIKKIDFMSDVVGVIEEKSPQVVVFYKEKLENRVQELLTMKVDDAKLANEVAFFADKCCIDEEIVRLKSHLKHVTTTLSGQGSVGRKLDFLAQEMNRESNTILSKANHIDISNQALELKTEIEKIREQIQNIE